MNEFEHGFREAISSLSSFHDIGIDQLNRLRDHMKAELEAARANRADAAQARSDVIDALQASNARQRNDLLELNYRLENAERERDRWAKRVKMLEDRARMIRDLAR